MKMLWQYKWTILLSPMAALGVVICMFYIGYINISELSSSEFLTWVRPYRIVIDLFSDETRVELFGYAKHKSGIVAIEAMFVYLIYRTVTDLRAGYSGINITAKDLFYLPYFVLIWIPFRTIFMLIMNM